MKYNPTTLSYTEIEPGMGPRFGVTSSQSDDFTEASSWTYAWFVNLIDAFWYTRNDNMCRVWDLEDGIRLK